MPASSARSISEPPSAARIVEEKRSGSAASAPRSVMPTRYDAMKGDPVIAVAVAAVATLVLVAPDAETRIEAARAALDEAEGGASES